MSLVAPPVLIDAAPRDRPARAPTFTPEQMAIRARSLGSSDVASAIGLNPFRGPIDLWLDKTGRLERNDSAQTDLGHDMEDLIICPRYARENEVELQKLVTIEHPEYRWVSATPDRDVLGRDGLVEAKNVGHRMVHHWSDGVPDCVAAQAQWQMEVMSAATGREYAWVDVAVVLGGRDYEVWRIHRDRELVGAMLELAERFWRVNVLGDVTPSVGAGEATQRYLAKRFPRDIHPLKDAPAEAEALVREFVALHERAKRLEATSSAIKAQLQLLIGEAAGIKGPWGVITWKQARPTTDTGWERMAADLLALVRYLVTKYEGEEAAASLPIPQASVALYEYEKPGSRRFLPKLR